MSEAKYIYYWNDHSSWILNTGFGIYTVKQVNDFIKKNPQVKFSQLGPESSLTDLSYNMYKKMEYDIINEEKYRDNNTVYESHHHTVVLSTISPNQDHTVS